MTHEEHVHLIRKAITERGGTWADFGSGDGAFTLALRDLTGEDVFIYSIDKDKVRLQRQEIEFKKLFPKTHIQFITSDFTKHLHLPTFDGVIMANSLHYVKDQKTFLVSLKKYLKPHGKLVLVEYNIDVGNTWVPYPLSYKTFERLVHETGFIQPALLERIPSTYWNEMYSAQANTSTIFLTDSYG
jgi:ubiquinone/menaquinone biosynthesis C-methylase UbiE